MDSTGQAVVVGIRRSPVGRAHKGSLVDVRPDDLAAGIVTTLLDEYPQLPRTAIDDVICGCAFPWGEQGYNVGRNIGVLAGLPHSVPGQTITRLCASSLQALRAAAHAIALGEARAVVAVGVESVSRVGRGHELAQLNPLLDPAAPGDTLGAVFLPMGLTAENVARQYGVTRAEMDRYALRSQELAAKAQAGGSLGRHVVPIGPLAADESLRPQSTLDGLAALRPVFQEDGTVTAGNSCPLNDGAAAALVMDERYARHLGFTPMARILGSAVSAVDPALMGVGPIDAIRRVLDRTGITMADVDVLELNEAFAAQVIPVCREVGIDPFDDRCNPLGGAIAIGHPFGMTGLRMMSSLLTGLADRDATLGLETMCVGGGQGQAMLVERLA
ncbi:MAG TPA: acetyl-CoA C-acyltransferase [Pseudonocardiaceae bacterium]|nr:acetyl-CoA C-acyltransferase [Pseudonocardiaceae bacterium]